MEDSINKKYPGNYEKRKQLRLEKEKPVLEAFWSWLDQQKPVRNTRLDKAVNYVLNRRDIAETYLEDGRCSFTNNLSENAIRPFAVGRKNWLFSSSVDGANASAVVYTMVEMAKAHGLNIYGYLKFLLENRPSKNMTDEQLAAKTAEFRAELAAGKTRDEILVPAFAVARESGNLSAAARRLGITRPQLAYRLRRGPMPSEPGAA